MTSAEIHPLACTARASNGVFPWTPDNGDGTYQNPVIHADYSDPDPVRVGDDFYLTASSFNCVPGLPILHSRDLVNWTIIGHVFQNYPVAGFDVPRHGGAVWAPSLRHHHGEFYVYFGDPDQGVFMSRSKNPAGPWSPLHLVHAARGWIDTCPFWDDDGQAYLVHAWAKSRSGINSILTLCRMDGDGTKLLDEGRMVFDGHAHHPIIEGPKLYRRNGWYYIFAPAGGVKTGWQTVLRSKNIFGPYEDKIVLAQGRTDINGPHQGGWVETQTGESWFVHFQDRGVYGRVVHLQPMRWLNDWPVIGDDPDRDGTGEPVKFYRKPNVGRSHPPAVPQTTDEFDSAKLGLPWQWQANFSAEWISLTSRPGWLRLYSIPLSRSAPCGTTLSLPPTRDGESDGVRGANLWSVPNLVMQKFPAPEFTITTKLDFSRLAAGGKAGLLVMGMDYAYLAVERTAGGCRIARVDCRNAHAGGREVTEDEAGGEGSLVFFRVEVRPGAVCHFSHSRDGKEFVPLGKPFTAREGNWIGAKVGLFSLSTGGAEKSGHADFDWFKFG